MSQKKIKAKFQLVKGMRDILPRDQVYWEKLRETVKSIAKNFGFGRLDTPILEDTELFVKGTGSTTDIVQKEMFTLTTKGRDKLTLRPEFTPGFVRAYLENGMMGLPQPVKLYTTGPIFRYEKPQKGRYRQAYQANFEIIGESDPVLDARSIQLCFAILRKLGIKNLITQINSIGCSKCRSDFKKPLIRYYKSHKKDLCSDCSKRLDKNPLRLLDCKNEKCIAIGQEAPQVIDYLCDECRNHFKDVLDYLDELEIPYILNHSLVRGLDYYTKTVFEVWPEGEEGRQISLAGGGRYDKLVKLLGGRDTPAVGFALGMDRIVSLMKERDIKISDKSKPEVFLVQLGNLAKKQGLRLVDEFRRSGLEVAASFSRSGIKQQLKLADKMRVPFALILGQKEALDESIIIRDMKSGAQETVLLEKVVQVLKKKIKSRKK